MSKIWDMSHIGMIHVTHMNGSWLIYMFDPHQASYVRHYYMCDISNLHVWPTLIYMFDPHQASAKTPTTMALRKKAVPVFSPLHSKANDGMFHFFLWFILFVIISYYYLMRICMYLFIHVCIIKCRLRRCYARRLFRFQCTTFEGRRWYVFSFVFNIQMKSCLLSFQYFHVYYLLLLLIHLSIYLSMYV